MSSVIDRYKDIMDSAKDFDTFIKNKLSKMSPIEVDVSIRIADMIQEAEVILALKLDNYESIIKNENKRLSELQNKLDKEQEENNKQLSYVQKERADVEALSIKYIGDSNTLKKSVEEYNQKKLELDQQQKEVDSSLCNIKVITSQNETILKELLKEKQDVACAYANLQDKERSIIDIENKVEDEKKDIKSAYMELAKQRENIDKEVKRISDIAIDEKLKHIKEIEDKAESKEQAVNRKLKEVEEKIKEYEVKKKNLTDKEYNLKAYESTLNIKSAKFQEELRHKNV